MAKPAAKLCPFDWSKVFQERSSSIYSGMKQRHKRKGFPPPEFTLEDLRGHLLRGLNNMPDGVIQCRYCGAWIDVTSLAVDHAIPISRGGGLGLDNLEFPCRRCNAVKGGLNPTEFLALRGFVQNLHPAAAKDITQRLEIAVQLAAGAWAREKRQKGKA